MIAPGSISRSCTVDQAATLLGVSGAWVRKKLSDPTDPLPGLPPRSEFNAHRGWVVDADALEELVSTRHLGALTRLDPPRRMPPSPGPSTEAGTLAAELERVREELHDVRTALAERSEELARAQELRALTAEREAALLRDELAGALDAIDALTSKRRTRLLNEDLGSISPR